MSMTVLAFRVSILAIVAVMALSAPSDAAATEPMEGRIEQITPALEAYIGKSMEAFAAPGLAIGIVADDMVVYAKGFGSRTKGGAPVDTDTVFQIGSTTKAFLATTLAMGVDRGAYGWDDRIVDLHPDFRLKDGWVTNAFRVYDIIAQRSGLPSYVNDAYAMLGAEPAAAIRSLRYVEPTESFRAAFTYTNITHLVAGDIVADAFGVPEWTDMLAAEIFAPLGMTHSSFTAEAIDAAPNHAMGHVWSLDGPTEAPFTRFMPYEMRGAGAINSTIDDMGKWLRLQLADGEIDGKRIVSAANLDVTRMPRVAMSDRLAYAMGWVIQSTPNGTITWHNGGTAAFGAYVGLLRDHDVGVVVLTNETNMGLPDAVGEWLLDRLLGNPEIDHASVKLAAAKAAAEATAHIFDVPADARSPLPAAALAGNYVDPVFGRTSLAADGAALVATLTTGAKLRLDPWDGETFTISLMPEGEMAPVVANTGKGPMGFAAFETDSFGKMSRFRATFGPGTQEYLFIRQ